jgi:hypothetical protein
MLDGPQSIEDFDGIDEPGLRQFPLQRLVGIGRKRRELETDPGGSCLAMAENLRRLARRRDAADTVALEAAIDPHPCLGHHLSFSRPAHVKRIGQAVSVQAHERNVLRPAGVGSPRVQGIVVSSAQVAHIVRRGNQQQVQIRRFHEVKELIRIEADRRFTPARHDIF